MDVLQQIKVEQEARDLIAKVYPAEQLEKAFSSLLERKRLNVLRTAETVLLILKNLEETLNNG